MTFDVLALRRVTARFFGVFMSVNPVLAALIGLVILHQALSGPDWLAIAVIVAANAVSVSSGYRTEPGRPAPREQRKRSSEAGLAPTPGGNPPR